MKLSKFLVEDHHLPPGEPVSGKTYRADGWVYREIYWCEISTWNRILGAIGDGQYVILARTTRGPRTRGQLMISPTGMSNIAFQDTLPEDLPQ